MTTDRLVTEYTADTSNFVRGAAVYDKTLDLQARRAVSRLNTIDARWERSNRTILRGRTALAGALTGLVSAAAIGQLRQYAEGWRQVERSLQAVGAAGDTAGKTLVGVALRSRTDIGGTAAAVQRLAKSTGADLDATARRVETLQKLLAVGGASSGERASVSLQLGQALQAGVLSGDEYKSIAENAPVEFLEGLAKAAGITRAELKKFAADQKLTTDVVLRALDDLASTADAKFGVLAVSGGEAFDVLQTGLTAYVGNVDKSLGATATINDAMVGLGTYLSEVEGGAQAMADALQVVAAMAVATAGGRGVGALNAALERSTASLRLVASGAQAEANAARVQVAAKRAQVAASQALVVQRRAEVVASVRASESMTKFGRAMTALEASKRKSAAASTALSAAEVRAAIATDRLAAAQARLSISARASAAALTAARGVLAFFGGPVGLAITALAALPLLLAQSGEKTDALASAADQAQASLDRYAEASKRVGEEQERMGGKVTAATQAILTQSRVELQGKLRKLREEQRALADDLRGNGIFDVSEIAGPLGVLNRAQNALAGANGGTANRFLSEAVAGLQDLQDGKGDLLQIVAALSDVRGVGQDARQVMRDYQAAVSDGALSLADARAKMVQYAEAAGIFGDQIRAIEAAQGPVAQQAAFDDLARSLFEAADASAIIGGAGVDAVVKMAQRLAETALQADLVAATLAGDTEQAEALAAQLAAAQGKAADLEATRTPDYAGSAESAGTLADELERAVKAAIKLRSQSVDGLQRAQIDNRFRTDPVGRARALAEAEFDNAIASKGLLPDGAAADLARQRAEYVAREVEAEKLRQATQAANQADADAARSGGKKKGGSGAAAAKDAERDLAEARGLLLENGQRALFIEKELNAERARLQELLPSLIGLGLSEADARAVVNSELERTEERLKRVQTASEQAAAAFARGILDDLRHAQSLEDAVGKIGDRLLDLALDPVFDMLANSFAKMATGGGTGGGIFGFIAKAVGGLFSGEGAVNANGNAFDRTGVVPFARGGVVDRATPFTFGNGRLGVMGEAGPEAILPLRRGADGKLGVVAEVPTVPTVPAGAGGVSSSFTWSGDMVVQSQSDDPQAVGAEVMGQMRGMFTQMFGKALSDSMRAGGALDQTYSRKGGA